jgi:hypothetical protein
MSTPNTSGNRKETATKRYIRLLSQLAEATAAMHTTRDEPRMDVIAFDELVESGFIKGMPLRDSTNFLQGVDDMRITVPGRLFLEELQEKESLKTSWGLIKKHRFSAYKWFFGIGSGGVMGFYLREIVGFFNSN